MHDKFVLKVRYSPASGVFFAGENVVGKIIVSNKDTIRSIALRAFGESRVAFRDIRARKTSDFAANVNPIIDKLVARFGAEDNFSQDEALYILPGEHEFSFSFQLPELCPNSYEGKYGSTEYQCKVSVWFADSKGDRVFEHPFTVIGLTDLNFIGGSQEPVTEMSEGSIISKSTGCFASFKSHEEAKLIVQARASRKGAVCGELLPFQLTVHNKSRHKVRHTRLRFMKLITYYMRKSESKTEEKLVTEVFGKDVIGSGKSVTWKGRLPFPPLPPTVTSNPIQIQYQLKFSIATKNLEEPEVEVNLPIVVGTIPLIRDFKFFQSKQEMWREDEVRGFQEKYERIPMQRVGCINEEINMPFLHYTPSLLTRPSIAGLPELDDQPEVEQLDFHDL